MKSYLIFFVLSRERTNEHIMDTLKTIFLNSEQEYIDKFCAEYKDEIKTPDGFIIVCKYLNETALHICGGKSKKFQPTRARYILWPKYILLHLQERTKLFDNSSKNIIFFLDRSKISYAVICGKLRDGRLNLISGIVVGGKRAVDYRKGNPPYSFL